MSMSVLGQASQSGAKAARIGSKCEPRREVWRPARFVTWRKSPCAVFQIACVMFPRSKRPVLKARCLPIEIAAKPAAKAAIAGQRRSFALTRAPRAGAASARRARPRSRALDRRRARQRTASARQPGRRRRRRRSACASASGSPGGTSRALCAVGEQLAGGRRVGGDERRAAGERLEGLVRDHAAGLAGRAEDPERAAGAVQLFRQALVLDPGHVLDVRRAVLRAAASSWPEPTTRNAELGRESRGGEDRLESVERDQLADEEAGERLARRPAGPEDALLGADEADGDAVRVEPGERRRDGRHALACRRRRGRRRAGRGGRPLEDRGPRASPAGSARGRRRTCRRARRAG